jgi:hypothetical protein
VNHLDIAPPHASVLMGLSNTVATLPGIISPPLAGAIVTHKVQPHSTEVQVLNQQKSAYCPEKSLFHEKALIPRNRPYTM